MSPLTDRDTNVQATSNPFQTDQTISKQGGKMQQENAQQHKQILEQKAEGKGYVCTWRISSICIYADIKGKAAATTSARPMPS